jgi:CheY-like chemotaxis protein
MSLGLAAADAPGKKRPTHSLHARGGSLLLKSQAIMQGVPNDSPRGGIAVAQFSGGQGGGGGSARRSGYARFAHDINNPLAIVLSNIEFAIDELSSQPGGGGELVEALGEARQAVERIRDVVIAYENEIGDGAAVTLAPEPVPQSTRMAPQKARVLVVDDEPMLGRAIGRGLREHEVVAVTSGAEALALLQGGDRFDVILCDLMMPDMPGFDLHDQLRLVAPDQAERMVFMTGGATTTRAREFVQSWHGVVLQKPVSMDAVSETVSKAVATRSR